MVLKLYALDHDGRYPDTLGALPASGIVDQWASIVLSPASQGETPEPAAYYGAGLTDSSPGSAIILASARPRTSRGIRIVAYNDGSVTTVPEAEFQAQLARQLERLAAGRKMGVQGNHSPARRRQYLPPALQP